jgi:hypothetical protein
VKLTALEVDVLKGLYASEYHDGGPQPYIWSWAIRNQLATPAQLPGVVSSLAKKGITRSDGSGEERAVAVTELGAQVARELGIYTEEETP